MRPYADASPNVTAKLKVLFNNLKSQGDFDMERIEAVDLVADSEEYVVKVKWVGLGEEETIDAPLPEGRAKSLGENDVERIVLIA